MSRSSSSSSHCTSHRCISLASPPLLPALDGARPPPELTADAAPPEWVAAAARIEPSWEEMSDSTGSDWRLGARTSGGAGAGRGVRGAEATDRP
jgi:hypothetical protein